MSKQNRWIKIAIVAWALPVLACEQTADTGEIDLPNDWTGALNIFVEPCMMTEPEFDEQVALTGGEDFVRIDVTQAHFRCMQPLEAYYLVSSDEVKVLIQPVDMDPEGVAACDCGYNIIMGIDDPPAGEPTVSVYRRWDNWNDSNDTVLIGSGAVSVMD